MIPPVHGPVIQTYNLIHRGIDIACLPGSTVVAMADGYGHFVRDRDMGWQFVQVTSHDGVITLSHLGEPRQGRWYRQGEEVSVCGSTGRLSAGPHVHIDGSKPLSIMAVFDL